ncbi:HNH endonuclease [Microvirga zambiensis]|uniref:HNH endonuclease n=1 Tax=Microvirga zambiensis TaxID=1402137 RepID=UPI00191CC3CB|nr:HNH endonuclease [Microvirga zambiensis]
MKPAQRIKLFGDVYARDKGCCVYCGKPARRPGRGVKRAPDLATLDHVAPRSAGGPLARDNLVLACSACNNERGTMDAAAFRALKAAGRDEPISTPV